MVYSAMNWLGTGSESDPVEFYERFIEALVKNKAGQVSLNSKYELCAKVLGERPAVHK